ncbi:MAG: tetratricopeptide repeat protein [Rhodospirillaceae bacterium]|nr:tetratricopeptide repeat protein [Rhodospirillaceae bacterium]
MDSERSIIDGLLEDAEAALAAGSSTKARVIYAGILAIDPDHVLALRQLAALALSADRHDEALGLFTRALNLKPDDPDLYHGIATTLRLMGRVDEAILAFTGALRVDPRHHPALYDLALIYQQRGRFADADQLYDRAAVSRWDHFESILNRGVVLFRQDRLPEAERWFHHAALLKSEDPRPLINLAMIYRVWGRLDGALRCLERAAELAPDNPDVRWNLANALLASGDFARGWSAYEWRFKRPGRAERAMNVPKWVGEPLGGKTLLLAAEQGVGDMIQFARFAEVLADRGARVVIECHPGLERLLATVPGVAHTVRLGAGTFGADVYLPIMSVPQAIGLTFDAIPARVPYLRPPSSTSVPPLPDGGFKVGLVWRGNPLHENDAHRSIALTGLAPLLGVPGARFFSLQMGEGTAELAAFPAITDLSSAIGDFAHTAALVAQLDLVISVDTAVAHLAGAMAKPVWILIGRGNDWRWFAGREDSPWYPTARLFRQTAPRDWAPAVAAMAGDLATLVQRARVD